MVARGLIAAVHGPVVTSSKRGGRVAARSTRASHPSVPSEAGGDDVPSNKASRRAVLAAVLSTPLAAPALAVDLEALNEDIMRVADPERYSKDASKVELERQLGAPGSPVNAPGMDKGVDGERDVVTTPSGLSYADVEIGRGNKVKVGDLVVANVVGYTPDGKVFENTYTRGTALTFQLGIRPPACARVWSKGLVPCGREVRGSSPCRARLDSASGEYARRWAVCRPTARCDTRWSSCAASPRCPSVPLKPG